MTEPENRVVSDTDNHFHALLRANVSRFVSTQGRRLDGVDVKVLDIAPQDHEGARPYFPSADIRTLDIDPAADADYTADLCQNNSQLIADDTFDVIVCTEVLEHTENPFRATDELYRMLRVGGTALISTPFNFRIHGPLPDNWRFTEHGLRQLLSSFMRVTITELEDPNRFLAPIQYTVIALK